MTTSSTRPARAHLLWLLFPTVLTLTGCGLLDNLPFEHLLMAEPDQTHLEEVNIGSVSKVHRIQQRFDG